MPAPRGARFLGIAAFVILAVLGADAALYGVYRSTRNRLEEELGRRLVAVASGLAAAVNGESWAGLLAGDPAAIASIRLEIDEVRRVNGVAAVFLFDREQRTLLDPGGRYPTGEPNPSLLLDLEAVTTAMAGWPAATRLYSSRGEYLKSAYAPVTDPAGLVIGGVGVEASAEFFQALGDVRRTLIAAAVLVSSGLLLLGMVLGRVFAAREALEARLRRTETLATLGQMTAMLAHEIRNPLGIIRGAAERLGERHRLADDELFRFIPEEVDRLEQTLGTYLDFSRPGGHEETEDLSTALRRTLDFLGLELGRRGITVREEIEPGEFPVHGDAHLLRQSILNVLLNARDAMGAGGILTARISRQGSRAVLEIVDTGEGMTEDVRRRATEPFFTSKSRGSGLGLAVVRRLTDDLGGKLEIRSEPGKGTTVSLSLPLGEGRDAVGVPDVPMPRRDGGGTS